MSIRILLADDHAMMREGLRTMLEKQADVEVVGEAENGRMAVQLARKLRPDVVLMDITMPDLNGIEATRQILAECPGVKIVALSMHSDRLFAADMLKAGASGYVLKNSAFQELSSAIRAALAGDTYLSPKTAGTVVKDYVLRLSKDQAPAEGSLTAREREVLQLLAEGKSTKEIATILSVSVSTVETHRRQICDKLGTHRLADLTKRAIRAGLTSLDA